MDNNVGVLSTYYEESGTFVVQMTLSKSELVLAFTTLADKLNEQNEILQASVNKTYVENNWLTKENYWNAILEWKKQLTETNLAAFIDGYTLAKTPKKVGIIMAGNIPLVGFHDMLCVLLSGHTAIVKPSSDDKYVITLLCKWLIEINTQLKDRIQLVERLTDIDAVIATGSNNSFRYFEQYFSKLPSLLRKSRKSMAILTGEESNEELELLADDIFQYFGLGCRNVSLLMLPRTMKIERVLDATMGHRELINHNKYANNYTYHRALLLMNSEQHLDTGFALPKERLDLHAPLACLHYAYYDDIAEVKAFIQENQNDIQCIVGNYSNVASIPFGKAQKPDLQDFADGKNTLTFLSNI